MDLPEHESISMESVEDGGAGNQFEATLIWESIVNHLESSMKCGRHTQALRSFTNCFHGSAAVDCLLPFLCNLLSKPVRREQVQILCHKLLITGVIEDVRSKEKEAFRESRLYRLTRNHFWSISSINSSNQDLLVEHELSRAKSAEDLTEKEDSHFGDDLKGYASDSTISCSGSRRHSVHTHKKKRRGSSRKKHASGTSDLVLKKEAGFFQSIGTKLLLSTSWNKVSNSRLIFKGSDNTISSGQGESSESLAPPETKQRRKMAATRRQLKGPLPISMEEENEDLFLTSSRSGSWDKKRASDASYGAKKRWSTDKMLRDSPPSASFRNADKYKEDRVPFLNVSTVADAWYDFPDDHYHHGMRSPKKETSDRMKFDYLGVPDRHIDKTRVDYLGGTDRHTDKMKFDYFGGTDRHLSSDQYTRKVIMDKEREPYLKGMAWNAARRGSVGDAGPPPAAARTTRRKSIDVGVPFGVAHTVEKTGLHSRRRKKSREEFMLTKSSTHKEKMDFQHTPARHKPSSSSLKKKKHPSPSRHTEKPGKRKHVHRSHSFSSVEDFMAGPSDQTPSWSSPKHNHHHLPLVQDSGNKWIVYGYV